MNEDDGFYLIDEVAKMRKDFKRLKKQNKILKDALSKYVNAIENNHALLWSKIFEDFKRALEEIKEIK